MTERQKSAITCFRSGLNCSQAVFSVFCEDYGLDKTVALKLACGLGGGFRSGEVCGAVSGTIMIIGLKNGQSVAEDTASKASCYAKTEEFIKAFKEKHGTILCRDIIGIDISTEEGKKQAQDKSLFRAKCDEVVKSAVGMLEDSGY